MNRTRDRTYRVGAVHCVNVGPAGANVGTLGTAVVDRSPSSKLGETVSADGGVNSHLLARNRRRNVFVLVFGNVFLWNGLKCNDMSL